MDTGVADEDFVNKGGDACGTLYQAIHTHRNHQPVTPTQPVSQHDSHHSQFWSQLTQQTNTTTFDHDQNHHQIKREDTCDTMGPTGPTDFGWGGSAETGLAYEDYYNEVRDRYVMGVQLIVQFQCEALVEKFKVSLLICRIVVPIWLRFVALSGFSMMVGLMRLFRIPSLKHKKQKKMLRIKLDTRQNPTICMVREQ